MNVDTESFIEENEPYNTLSTYRLVPPKGPAFGVYFQADVLFNRTLHDAILPKKLGFKSLSKREADSEVHFRHQDRNYYVRLYKVKGLQVRLRTNMGWTNKI